MEVISKLYNHWPIIKLIFSLVRFNFTDSPLRYANKILQQVGEEEFINLLTNYHLLKIITR